MATLTAATMPIVSTAAGAIAATARVGLVSPPEPGAAGR
jgi:hypothetical protein